MANNFYPTLRRKSSYNKEAKIKQEKLHKKYKDISKSQTIFLESKTKVFLETFNDILQNVIYIVLALLAIIGLVCLMYPETRTYLLARWAELLQAIHWTEFISMFKG